MQNCFFLICSCCQIVLQISNLTILSKEQANNEELSGFVRQKVHQVSMMRKKGDSGCLLVGECSNKSGRK